MIIFKTSNKIIFILLISFVFASCASKEQTPPPVSEVPGKEAEVVQPKPKPQVIDESATTEIFLKFIENKENQVDSIIEINNNGSKSAINVNSELFLHYYSDETKSIKATVDSPTFKPSVDFLPPYSKKSFKLNTKLVDFYSNYPKEHVALQFKTTYVSDADQKEHIKNTVFYLSPEGNWVYETDPSLVKGNKYKNIMASINKILSNN